MAAEAGAHQFGPAITRKVAGEKLALAAEFLALRIHVVHELVDQRDGDLLHLRFRIGHFADEYVAGGVDAAFGIGVEHYFRRLMLPTVRRVRIWEMAISFSLRRRSGWDRP